MMVAGLQLGADGLTRLRHVDLDQYSTMIKTNDLYIIIIKCHKNLHILINNMDAPNYSYI